jgi:hypothetical protein
MARCPVELLDDLADVLSAVRGWEGVVEKSPGVFYARRLPFLHFHLVEGGRRRADVKSPTGWRSFDLPRPLPATHRRQLVRALKAHHAERVGPASKTARRASASPARAGG